MTGEQSSEVDTALARAIDAGLRVAHATEDEPWVEVTCVPCGAVFKASRHGPASLVALRDFVRLHAMDDSGAEER